MNSTDDQMRLVLKAMTDALVEKMNLPGAAEKMEEVLFGDPKSLAQSYRIVEVYELAVASLGSPTAATNWLFAENPGLGGDRPYDRLDNQRGVDQIKNILTQIEHGLIS
jgi:uncharacterized protein (DUF2384 family)